MLEGIAGKGGGGIIGVDSHFGVDCPAAAHIRTRSTILHMKNYCSCSPKYDY